MQGLDYPAHVIKSFPSDTLSDLAGNAYHSGCAAATTLAFLITASIGWQRLQASHSDPLRYTPIFSSLAGRGDDDAEETDAEDVLSSFWKSMLDIM